VLKQKHDLVEEIAVQMRSVKLMEMATTSILMNAMVDSPAVEASE
jgi:hypothetical protein